MGQAGVVAPGCRRSPTWCPDRWHGRQTLEMFVPTEVVVGRHGDCDSKSVTFALIEPTSGACL